MISSARLSSLSACTVVKNLFIGKSTQDIVNLAEKFKGFIDTASCENDVKNQLSSVVQYLTVAYFNKQISEDMDDKIYKDLAETLNQILGVDNQITNEDARLLIQLCQHRHVFFDGNKTRLTHSTNQLLRLLNIEVIDGELADKLEQLANYEKSLNEFLGLEVESESVESVELNESNKKQNTKIIEINEPFEIPLHISLMIGSSLMCSSSEESYEDIQNDFVEMKTSLRKESYLCENILSTSSMNIGNLEQKPNVEKIIEIDMQSSESHDSYGSSQLYESAKSNESYESAKSHESLQTIEEIIKIDSYKQPSIIAETEIKSNSFETKDPVVGALLSVETKIKSYENYSLIMTKPNISLVDLTELLKEIINSVTCSDEEKLILIIKNILPSIALNEKLNLNSFNQIVQICFDTPLLQSQPDVMEFIFNQIITQFGNAFDDSGQILSYKLFCIIECMKQKTGYPSYKLREIFNKINTITFLQHKTLLQELNPQLLKEWNILLEITNAFIIGQDYIYINYKGFLVLNIENSFKKGYIEYNPISLIKLVYDPFARQSINLDVIFSIIKKITNSNYLVSVIELLRIVSVNKLLLEYDAITLEILEALITQITKQNVEIAPEDRELFVDFIIGHGFDSFTNSRIIKNFLRPASIIIDDIGSGDIAEKHVFVPSSSPIDKGWIDIIDPTKRFSDMISNMHDEESAVRIFEAIFDDGSFNESSIIELVESWITKVTSSGLGFNEDMFRRIITSMISGKKYLIKSKLVVEFIATRLDFSRVILLPFEWICIMEYSKNNLDWLIENSRYIMNVGYPEGTSHELINLFKRIVDEFQKGYGWQISNACCLVIDIHSTLTNKKIIYKREKNLNNEILVQAVKTICTVQDVLYVLRQYQVDEYEPDNNTQFINDIIAIIKKKKIAFAEQNLNDFVNTICTKFRTLMEQKELRNSGVAFLSENGRVIP